MKFVANELMIKHFNIKRKDFIKTGIDVNYKIYVEDNKVVLVFEQALDLMDFINSARFPKVVYKNQKSMIKAMSGFVDAYKSCNDEVMSKFIGTCRKYPDYDYIISGFSFGGGLSQLACEDFNFRTRTNIEDVGSGLKAYVVTFGAPRIYECKGNEKLKNYVRACTKGIFNFSFVYDGVPVNPPKFLGYEGIDQYFIGKKNIWEFIKSINPWYGHRKTYFNRENYKNVALQENDVLEV